jgi:hypothetical protein
MTREAEEPRAGRPTSPPGWWGSRPLPWRWARQRLIDARNYWIVSVLPDGRPHSRPVWGVWLDEHLYFDTGSRIGSNLMANPEVTVHLESGDEVVILEGTAERITDAEEGRQFAAAYNPKYHGELTGPPGALFVVKPRLAFGWISDPTGLDGPGAIFGSTGTRWEFGRAEG